MSAILRLYPRAWRQRYGDELVALLEEHPATLLDHLDLIRGALDARLHPQVPGEDVAPEQEIPMDRRLLGIVAAIGGLVWIGAVATMFILPMGRDGYRQAELAFLGFAASYVLIGVALGLLGTRPGSSQSRMTGYVVVALSIVFAVLGMIPWPIFAIPVFGFPIMAVIAAIRGSRNGMFPSWLALAFFVGALGIGAGTTGGVETDAGLGLVSLFGFAALLLAGTAFTTHTGTVEVSPA